MTTQETEQPGNSSNRLSGRTALVTGAGKGIGLAIAERFAAEGANVVVNDVNAESVDAAVAGIIAAGGSALAGVADVSDSAQVDAMFTAAESWQGSVNILVNNAGLISPMLHFLEADEAWWRRIIDVNLTGTFLTCHRAAPNMVEAQHGVIINMSSGGATRSHRSFSSYDASKGGIEAFTRSLALDLGPYGIRANALMPGSIDTTGMNLDERVLRGENVPLNRIGEPLDMAGPAVFLASDDADYITGEVIKVDGGMLAQQRSATVDIVPPSSFPKLGKLA